MNRTRKTIVAFVSTAATVGGLSAVALTPAAADVVPGKVSGGVMTTDVNGDAVNQNHYAAKTDVYLSGGPNNANAHFLEAGNYFFAILDPGRQSDPNDGRQGNLSSPWDSAASRAFYADGAGHISAITDVSHHDVSSANVIQAAPFDDTDNNGGVYVAAVCQYVPTSESDPTAMPVDPKDCKYDAFKVDKEVPPPPNTGQSAPTADKSASPTHVRKVTWRVTKLVDGHSSETFNQSSAATVTYTIDAEKTVDYDTYGLTGTINVYNSNADALDVTVSEDGLVPDVTGSSCTLDTSGSLTVPGKDQTTNDPGTNSVGYTCTFTGDAPDESTSYTNTASVDYTLNAGTSDEVSDTLPVASDPFYFPAATLSSNSDPESVTISDTYNGGQSWNNTTISDSTSPVLSYQRTLYNSNCVPYPNTVTLTTGSGVNQVTVDRSSATVTFCGPNNGGLTMGWWQNKNGQALLKNNLTNACGSWNGYVGASSGTSSSANYLPDAYVTYYKSNQGQYLYDSTKCATPTTSNKSYLPVFDLNVFAAANASGTGTWMVEGQYLTTVLNTASGYVNAGAGAPTLDASTRVQIPLALQTASTTGIGLAACDTIGNLLNKAASQYTTYSSGKTAATSALITLLTKINQNQAQTCSP